MTIKDKILEALHSTPRLTANEIADKVGYKAASVKVILHKMIGSELVVREKQAKAEKPLSGPVNVYRYSVKPD